MHVRRWALSGKDRANGKHDGCKFVQNCAQRDKHIPSLIAQYIQKIAGENHFWSHIMLGQYAEKIAKITFLRH